MSQRNLNLSLVEAVRCCCEFPAWCILGINGSVELSPLFRQQENEYIVKDHSNIQANEKGVNFTNSAISAGY